MLRSKILKSAAAAFLAVGTFGAVPSFAGAVGGPRITKDEVLARHTDVYHIDFDGDEEARVRVDGDHDTILTIEVYDENGNLITSDSDADGTGFVLVKWTPRWTGTFTIRVINRGFVYNHYLIRTN